MRRAGIYILAILCCFLGYTYILVPWILKQILPKNAEQYICLAVLKKCSISKDTSAMIFLGLVIHDENIQSQKSKKKKTKRLIFLGFYIGLLYRSHSVHETIWCPFSTSSTGFTFVCQMPSTSRATAITRRGQPKVAILISYHITTIFSDTLSRL